MPIYMFRQSLGIFFGCIALISAHAQTANDCWAVRLGSIDRHPASSGVVAFKRDGNGSTYELRYVDAWTPSGGFICSKFDAGGSKLWESSYRATNRVIVPGPDLILDDSGALFVTAAISTNYAGDSVDVAVMRFDANGSRTLLSQFKSRGFSHRMAVNAAGDIFVTGVNFGAAVNDTSIQFKVCPVALTKLAANGNGLWCSKTNTTTAYEPEPPVLAPGPQRTLYAAWGGIYDHERAFVTARLTFDGAELWRRSYAWYNLYLPYSLLVDSEGNAFTTGSVFWGAPWDTHLTIKYSAEGTQLWRADWPEETDPGEIGAAALDGSGNLYVTLGIPRWRENALVTAKFDTDGNRLWTVYENAPAEDHYSSLDLMVDGAQSINVTGIHDSTNDYSRTTIAYLQNTTPALPVIYRQPTSGRVRAGTIVNLMVSATGLEPLVYQWRLDGENIADGTNSILVLSNIGTNQSGSYSVLVTNVAGCALSLDARITVIEIPDFRLSLPRLREIFFQESDGSWTTNQYIEMLLTGGRPGWIYTLEVSSNLVQWLPYAGRGVNPDGSAPFLFRRENQGSMFFRASTWP